MARARSMPLVPTRKRTERLHVLGTGIHLEVMLDESDDTLQVVRSTPEGKKEENLFLPLRNAKFQKAEFPHVIGAPGSSSG